MLTLPTTHSPEVLARRARVQELRKQILLLADKRRLIKSCYRLPHGQEQHQQELTRLCGLFGLKAYEWNRHARPGRHEYRDVLTVLHQELATLRGKVHGPPQPA